MKSVRIFVSIFVSILSSNVGAQLVDIDGNNYNTVVIGNQIWMAENLKVTKFQNGDPIPNVTDGFAWFALTTPAYCLYNNDNSLNSSYGKLYNWFTVQDLRNVCPTGWRVPNEIDFNELISLLDPTANNNGTGDISATAGGALKDNSTNYWSAPNAGATNTTGFTALPGGFRQNAFDFLGYDCFFWTTIESSSSNAWYRGVNHSFPSVSRFNTAKSKGFSVRCMKNCIGSSSSSSINSCGSYTAPDGQVYTQSGVYTAVIPNNGGCDSTITINLTIGQNSSSAQTETACGSYTAPDGQVYTQSGVYTAVIPNNGGCDSTITIYLTISNLNAGVTVNGINLTANQNGAQYQWINCATNQSIPTANSQNYSPISNGEYAVIVTSGVCSDTSLCYNINSLGLDDIEGIKLVYPNPTIDLIHIEIDSFTSQSFLLIDNLGKTLIEGKLTDNKTQVSLRGLENGTYYLIVKDQRLPIKIIKY